MEPGFSTVFFHWYCTFSGKYLLEFFENIKMALEDNWGPRR
jgi:hypothetical protein